jgi:hypothetical protein
MQSGGGTAHFSGSYGTLTVRCSSGNPSKCSLHSNNVALLSLVASNVLGTPGLLPTVHKSPQALNWLTEVIDDVFQKQKTLENEMVLFSLLLRLYFSNIL